jgi:hypothetical protein
LLVEAVRKIRENDIPHLLRRIEVLELAAKRGAKRELLGITIALWAATPIAFLSIPLIGAACAAAAAFSTLAYIEAGRRAT